MHIVWRNPSDGDSIFLTTDNRSEASFSLAPELLSRLVVVFYLTSLALLPWTWFPPFPWLHEHAQWSDAVFAAAAAAWALERLQRREWPSFVPAHAGLAVYLLLAALSLLFASPHPRAGALKLVGVAELCALAFITSDLAARSDISRKITRVIAITSLLTAAAAITGLVLFYAGIGSRLIGIYGELQPSPWYARVQAGTYNPNLLASFCIFGAAVVARRDGELPAWLRRITLAALWIIVFLTFSRGSLGFVVAALIRGAITPRRRAAAAVGAVAILSVTVALTVWKPSINPARPFDTRIENAASSRFQAASSSLKTLISHPILGSGLGTSPGMYRGLPFDSHLTPLNIAATLGLPALMSIAFLIGSLWRGRSRPTDLAIWGGLAGLALDGLAQDIEDFRHVWVMIGLAMAQTTGRRGTDTGEAGAERESLKDRRRQPESSSGV